jgi:DNA-binding transcriptional ArsR family regulator
LSYETGDELAIQAKSLADGNRLILLGLIHDAGRLCVSDLCLLANMEQGGVSRNLRILWRAKLLTREVRHGLAMYKLTDTGERLLTAILDHERSNREAISA